MQYFIGLDLGQAQDYTALAIAEKLDKEVTSFHIRHLQRYALGTAYPTIVADVQDLLQRDTFRAQALAVDGTGVGAPVIDMFRQAKLNACLYPILITGGDRVTRDGNIHRVPKRDLVGVVQACLQSSRLKIAAGLKEARTLTHELENFQVKISLDTAHDSYGAWREGAHDDLVLAVALALWVGSRPIPGPAAVGGPLNERGWAREIERLRRGLRGYVPR